MSCDGVTLSFQSGGGGGSESFTEYCVSEGAKSSIDMCSKRWRVVRMSATGEFGMQAGLANNARFPTTPSAWISCAASVASSSTSSATVGRGVCFVFGGGRYTRFLLKAFGGGFGTLEGGK